MTSWWDGALHRSDPDNFYNITKMETSSVIYDGAIVFLDSYTLNPGDLDWAELKQCPGMVCYDRTSPEDVVRRIGDARIVITNKTRLTEEIFAQLPDLHLVCVAATGYDVVDIAAAKRRGITVCNCAGYSTNAVAQMVLAHLLEVTNHVGHYTDEVCGERLWSKCPDFCFWDAPLMELEGLKAAIVGYGNIGSAVANRLRPFGVDLYTVSSKTPDQLPSDVKKLTIEEAFATCDIISLNCPLNAQNAGFVNASLLAHAREGIILINTGRGGLINEADVADALKVGKLKAYCCDVLAKEPALSDNPLLAAPNVYMTPHIAWASPNARRRIIRILSENIKAYLSGSPIGVVNP